MKNKIIIISIVLILAIVGIAGIVMNDTNNENQGKIQITINVFNKESVNIYSKQLETDKQYLIDVLKENQELKVITETGEYGEYINSIMDIEQGDNFYWSYYVDSNYATVGVSNCKIENGKVYDFKIESFNY